MTPTSRHLLGLSSLALFSLVLSGCGTTPSQTHGEALLSENRADALYLGEQYAAAARIHQQLADAHPEAAARDHHHLRVAQCLATTGNSASAILQIEELLEREEPPVDRIVEARAESILGEILKRAGRDEEAASHLSRALSTGGSDVKGDSIRLSLGVVLQRLGRWTEADRHLHGLVTEYPISPLRGEAERRGRHTHFSIQVAAFRSASSALAETERLSRSGLPVRLEKADNDPSLYCVRIGRYDTWREAVAAKVDMFRRGRIANDSFLVP